MFSMQMVRDFLLNIHILDNSRNNLSNYMTGRIGELLLILLIIFVLFGAGKLPKVMGELGKGLKSLKKGMKEENKNKED